MVARGRHTVAGWNRTRPILHQSVPVDGWLGDRLTLRCLVNQEGSSQSVREETDGGDDHVESVLTAFAPNFLRSSAPAPIAGTRRPRLHPQAQSPSVRPGPWPCQSGWRLGVLGPQFDTTALAHRP